MATVEALDELYAMGFILEHEYHQRRAALGAPIQAKEPETTATDSNPPETTANPLETDPGYPYNAGYPPYREYDTYPGRESGHNNTQDLGRTDIPVYHPPEPLQEYPHTPINDTLYDPSNIVRDIHIEPEIISRGPNFGVHATLPSETDSDEENSDEETPAAPLNTESRFYPTLKIEKDVENFPNLQIPRAEDSSHADAFGSGLGGRAGVVVRTAGSYVLHQFDVPDSATSILTRLGYTWNEYELLEAGQWKVETTKEMYWTETKHMAPPASGELKADKVYVLRPRKISYSRQHQSTPIDERELYKTLRSQLSGRPGGVYPYDEFEGDPHIADLRTFTVTERSYAFDPREAILFYRSKLNVTKIPTSVATNNGRVPKLKTSPAPPNMLWPLLISQLRAMQAQVSEAQCRMLPACSADIWERIEKSLQSGECYFTGEPVHSGSFLCERLHNVHIGELVRQIIDNNLIPTPKKKKQVPPPSVYVENPSIWSVTDSVERISYDSTAKKRSYGWPCAADLTNDMLRPFGESGRPIAVTRGPDILPILKELIERAGPAATVDP